MLQHKSQNELRKLSFFEYAQRYMDVHASEHAFSTKSKYQYSFKKLTEHIPANLKLTSLTPGDIGELKGELKKTLGSNTVNDVIKFISIVSTFAMREGVLKANPAFHQCIKHIQSKEIKPFTPEEMRKIIDRAYLLRPDIAVYFPIAYFSGLRSGEILALTKDDIDMKNYLIHVSKTASHGRLKLSTKTYQSRAVPILSDLDTYLYEHLDYMSQKGNSSQILISQHTQKPIMSVDVITDVWVEILTHLKIPHRQQYNLRHTFACTMIHAGEPLSLIASMLGHSSMQITATVYAKWLIPLQGRVGKKVHNYIENTSPTFFSHDKSTCYQDGFEEEAILI